MAGLINQQIQKSSGGLMGSSGGLINKLINKSLGGFGDFGKADTSTSQGLYDLARTSGLQKEADRLLAEQEGESKKIFSGGLVTDFFDALNVLQYGVVGTLKGKGFVEGVKNRESWSDKDALGDLGIPGIVGGIALDIASDPLTYIAPWTALKKIPGVAKGASKLGKVVETSKIGQWFGQKFVYRFAQDPKYAEIAERTIKNIAVGENNIKKLAEPFYSLDGATQRAISEARKVGKLESLAPEVLNKVKPLFTELDRLSKEAIDVLPLTPAMKETYKKNIGTYLRRSFLKYEAPEKMGLVGKVKGLFGAKPLRVDEALFKMKKDLPDDILEALGEIKEAGYPTVKAMLQLNRSIENAKLFTQTVAKFGSDVAKEGFEKLPQTIRLGNLSGKFVPKPIFDDIQEIIRSKSDIEKGLGKIVAGFKFSKVVLNPGTHGRNIIGNKLLNYFDPEGIPLWRLDKDFSGLKSLVTKDEFYQRAVKQGADINTFAFNELRDLLLGQEGLSAGQKFGKKWNEIIERLSGIYQGEETWAKLSMFKHQLSKGMTDEQAWKIAERATFNYSQVTPFVRRLRESIFGFPFITFTVKATPIIGKAVAIAPTKISNIGKIKNAIEKMANIEETERERATEPEWVKNGFYVKLPIKDKYNRSAYLDLTYILPFGDLVNLGDETNLNLIKKSPFINILTELGSNKDFYGNRIWKESDSTDQKLKDVFRHITKTYSPVPISEQIPGGYDEKGVQRQGNIARALTASPENQKRNLMEEMLRYTGMKIQPIDADIQETYLEWNKRKALERLLLDRGILQEFKRTYLPK